MKQRQEIAQLKDECHALRQQIEELKSQPHQGGESLSQAVTKQSEAASSPVMAPELPDLNAPVPEAEKWHPDGHTS